MTYSFTNSKGTTYYLHTKKSITSTGKERNLFYFAKQIKGNSLEDVPAGYMVLELANGLPILKLQESRVVKQTTESDFIDFESFLSPGEVSTYKQNDKQIKTPRSKPGANFITLRPSKGALAGDSTTDAPPPIGKNKKKGE